MFRTSLAIAAAALVASAVPSLAAPVFATSVTAHGGSGGSCTIGDAGFVVNSTRTNLCNALGAPDHPGNGTDFGFLSTGNFSALEFSFGTQFTAPITLFEVSFTTGNLETLELSFMLTGAGGGVIGSSYLVNNNSGTRSGQTWVVEFNFPAGTPTNERGPFDTLWIVDRSTGGDGFDIDAISATGVSAVPLPAAGLLLVAGLGGLALMRRRAS